MTVTRDMLNSAHIQHSIFIGYSRSKPGTETRHRNPAPKPGTSVKSETALVLLRQAFHFIVAELGTLRECLKHRQADSNERV
ncbi:hypothetical protein E4U42_003419 [Claviceps africana]|uniref:Uncharacterized protein n=1 Tax=Claviceps africana TaxID=83212 RepID=A0A8K0J789_9HYPO|nr:hypothetical protein E4U42_003419 [Claviceps africana]